MQQNLNQNLHQSNQNCWSNYLQNYFVLLNSCKLLKKYKICKYSIFRLTNKEKVFWKFYFIICRAFLNFDIALKSIYLNSDCTIIIINRNWIKKHYSNLKICWMKNSIIIRKIEIIRYFMNEFIIFNIYISELINSKIEIIEIIIKIYLICNFKIKFLVNINVLNFKKWILVFTIIF